VVAKDPNIDMIAWAAMLPSKAGAWDGVETLQAMVNGTDKPIVGFSRVHFGLKGAAFYEQNPVFWLKAMIWRISRRGRSSRLPLSLTHVRSATLAPAVARSVSHLWAEV
jgi:hypothetical protein